jgi:aminoglycoside phosphotransferase family enzyme
MYKVAIKVSTNEEIIEKTFKALTIKGVERKTKKFYKKHKIFLTNRLKYGIIVSQRKER